jgi:hypothetical protein
MHATYYLMHSNLKVIKRLGVAQVVESLPSTHRP